MLQSFHESEPDFVEDEEISVEDEDFVFIEEVIIGFANDMQEKELNLHYLLNGVSNISNNFIIHSDTN